MTSQPRFCRMTSQLRCPIMQFCDVIGVMEGKVTLVRRWGIPLATATSAPLLVPVVRAEAGDAKEEAPAPPPPPTSRMVRPSDLPIYEEPEEVLNFEYHGRERTTLEEGVGVVRQQVEGVLAATRSTRERAVHIYETGKAHSMVKPQSKAPPPPPPAEETPKEAEKEEDASASAGDSADTPKPEGGEVRSAVVLSLPPGKTLVDTLAEQASDVTVWGFRLTDDTTAPPKPAVPEGFGTIGTGQVATAVVAGQDEAQAPREVVEKVKEGAAIVEEKLPEVEKVVVVVEEGVAAVVEKLGKVEEGAETVKEKLSEVEEKVEQVKVEEVEEAASSVAVEVLSPVLGKEEAQEVVEKVEEKVGEAVEEVVEAAAVVVEERMAPEAASLVEMVVEETQAAVESVNETAREVEGVVEQVTQVVEGKEGLFDKLVNLLSKPGQDDTQSGKAVEGTPGMPDSAKEVEAAPQVVHEAVQSSKVEGVVEVVKEDIQKVEEEATQGVESKEVDLSVVKKQPGVEDQVESTPAATPEGQAEVEAIPATPVVSPLEEREGLFDKLVSLFSKDAGQEKAAPPPVTEATHTTGEVEAAPQAAAEMPDTARELQETQVDTAPPTEADAVPPMPVQEAPAEVDAASPPAVQEAPAAAEEATSPATAPLVPQAEESEGLFDKLISFLSKDSKDASAAEVPDSAKQVEAAGESTSEVPDSAKQVEAAGEVTESAKEDLSDGEGEDEFVIVSSMGEASDVMDVLKPDSVLDKLRPTEPHLESTPAKAEVTPATTEASRTGDEKEQVAAMPVVEVETKAPEVRVTEEEGLFDKLVRLFTKDEERPASSSATVPSPDSAGGGGGVSTEPVPGEGGEAALPAAPGDVDTAQHQDVLEVAEHAAPIPDVLTVPSDTTQVPDAPPPPQHTTPAPAVPVGTAGTEPEETEGTLLEEPTPESPAPPPIKKVALLDKLSSLFQKEEPPSSDTPTAATQKPPSRREEDTSGAAVQEASPAAAGDSATPPPEASSGGGEGEAADSVAASGGKEEEEAALPAAEDTAAAQPQVSAPQTEAVVVEEGKDTIVQLTPPGPEKDYGQSSPEDSDINHSVITTTQQLSPSPQHTTTQHHSIITTTQQLSPSPQHVTQSSPQHSSHLLVTTTHHKSASHSAITTMLILMSFSSVGMCGRTCSLKASAMLLSPVSLCGEAKARNKDEVQATCLQGCLTGLAQRWLLDLPLDCLACSSDDSAFNLACISLRRAALALLMALMVTVALEILAWCCGGDVMLGKDAARYLSEYWFVLVGQLLPSARHVFERVCAAFTLHQWLIGTSVGLFICNFTFLVGY
ncbi:hypothetical protein E2C01_018001 [Portunus trituberculatus]|uniref:Uncharacterized protein n=1 Tax=Portunus trituberculatus TaxID=210409 RepID=A0A5B7DUB8_PORTR|nr:hypothetical protein [Portunus trituberculatus]